MPSTNISDMLNPKKLLTIALLCTWCSCHHNPSNLKEAEKALQSRKLLNLDRQGFQELYASFSPASYKFGDARPQQHDIHQGDPSRLGTSQSALFDLNPPPDYQAHLTGPIRRPTTTVLASSSQPSNENQQELNAFKIQSLPYYLIALLRYPLQLNKQRSTDFNRSLVEAIWNACQQSSFLLDPPRRLLSAGSESLEEGAPYKINYFIGKLCLRNAGFLISINQEIDDKLSSELRKTLNWLYDILHVKSDSPNQSHRYVKNIVNGQLQNVYTSAPSHTFDTGNGVKTQVSEFVAKEERVILEVLENYYKSTNENKWNQLFQGDGAFLKYYLMLTIDTRFCKKRYLKKYLQEIRGETLLPWNAESEVKDQFHSSPQPILNILGNLVNKEKESNEWHYELKSSGKRKI